MSDYEKNIDKIRKYFEEHKAERYPFENVFLREKDEYVKSLYFRMLCTLTRYTGEPSEMQVLYIRRLIAGSHAENKFEDYMRMALDLDTEDIDEFISVFEEDDLKYYFCIDGAILLSVIEPHDKNYELLAELIELLGITQRELRHLTTVAKAAISQSVELFNEAQKLASETTRNLSLYHYVANFYAGVILSTPKELHIYSCNRTNVDLAQHSTFRSKKVIIENISSALKLNCVFDGCEEVLIRNCKLTGSKCYLSFNRVGRVIIEDCEISDFTNRFACFKDTNHLTLSGNSFRNCGCISSSDIKGGILQCNKFDSIVFENNEFHNCYVARNEYSYNYWATGILLHIGDTAKTIDVRKNRFIGCECRNNCSKYTEAYITGYVSTKKENDNTCTGSVKRIFED